MLMNYIKEAVAVKVSGNGKKKDVVGNDNVVIKIEQAGAIPSSTHPSNNTTNNNITIQTNPNNTPTTLNTSKLANDTISPTTATK